MIPLLEAMQLTTSRSKRPSVLEECKSDEQVLSSLAREDCAAERTQAQLHLQLENKISSALSFYFLILWTRILMRKNELSELSHSFSVNSESDLRC